RRSARSPRTRRSGPLMPRSPGWGRRLPPHRTARSWSGPGYPITPLSPRRHGTWSLSETWSWSPHLPEGGADLLHEDLRLFYGGEVTAPVQFVPPPDVGVALLRPPPGWLANFPRKNRAPGRYAHRVQVPLPERLPVQAGRRGAGR